MKKNVYVLPQVACQRLDLGLDSPLSDINLVAAIQLDRRSISFNFDGLAIALDYQLDAVFVVTDAGREDFLLSSQARKRNRVLAGGNAWIEVCRLIGSSASVLIIGDENLERRHGGSRIGLGFEGLKSCTRVLDAGDGRAVSMMDFQSCAFKGLKYFTHDPHFSEDKSFS